MRSVNSQLAAREMLIALPDVETDMYRVHQLVWDHVARAVGHSNSKPSFIYRIDDGMIRVRSSALPGSKGSVSMLRESMSVSLDIAAVWGANHDEAVPVDQLESWCQEKLEVAGFEVAGLSILECEERVGRKFLSGRVHHIRIPVARIRARVKVRDVDACALAWVSGLGRGKRFGLGMLAH